MSDTSTLSSNNTSKVATVVSICAAVVALVAGIGAAVFWLPWNTVYAICAIAAAVIAMLLLYKVSSRVKVIVLALAYSGLGVLLGAFIMRFTGWTL